MNEAKIIKTYKVIDLGVPFGDFPREVIAELDHEPTRAEIEHIMRSTDATEVTVEVWYSFEKVYV